MSCGECAGMSPGRMQLHNIARFGSQHMTYKLLGVSKDLEQWSMPLFRFRLQGAPGTSFWGGLTVGGGLWHWIKGVEGECVWLCGFKDGRQVMGSLFTVPPEQCETNEGEQEVICGWMADGELLGGEGSQLESVGNRRKALSLPSDLNLWYWCTDLKERKEHKLC